MSKKIKEDLAKVVILMLAVIIVLNYQQLENLIIRIFEALTPIFIGILFAMVMKRPYEKVKVLFNKHFHFKDNINTILSLFTVYFLVFIFLITIMMTIVPELVGNFHEFVINFGSYMDSIQNYLNQLCQYIHISPIEINSITEKLSLHLSSLTKYLDTIIPYILSGAVSIIQVIINIAIAFVFSIYILSTQSKLKRQLKDIFKTYLPQKIYDQLKYLFYTAYHVFDNYVIGQVLEAIILGCLCFIGMIALGLDYAGLISVFIAVTALIPIFGAYLGGTVGFLLLFLDQPSDAIMFVIFLVILQQVEGNIIYPRVVGHKIGLPAIWVLFGVTVGGKLMGVVGMFIGIPLTTLVYTLLKDDIYKRKNLYNRN